MQNVHAATYLGSGGTTCNQYMEYKKSQPDVSSGIDLWLLGYLSGMNFMSAIATEKFYNIDQDLLKTFDAKTLLFFINKYCSKNGSNTLNNAANDLFLALKKTQ